MAYSIRCADAGVDCPGSFTTETKDELMKHIELHAKEAHPGLQLVGARSEGECVGGGRSHYPPAGTKSRRPAVVSPARFPEKLSFPTASRKSSVLHRLRARRWIDRSTEP